MIILGIDTSSNYLNVVLGEDGGLIAAASLNIPRKHIANIIRVLDNMFEKSDLTIKDVDLFVVVKGPGSFTGIRIAVTAVKGFAAALDKNVVSVTSLDVLAQNAFNTEREYIYPVLDAVRGNVYSACYFKEKGKITRRSGYMVTNIKEFLNTIKLPAVFLGEGLKIYQQEICSKFKVDEYSILDESDWLIKCENIIKLGYEKFRSLGSENITELTPLYLYPKECTVRK